MIFSLILMIVAVIGRRISKWKPILLENPVENFGENMSFALVFTLRQQIKDYIWQQ